jgi:hypothetical protein
VAGARDSRRRRRIAQALSAAAIRALAQDDPPAPGNRYEAGREKPGIRAPPSAG